MKLTLENFKSLKEGDRLRFGTRTVWEVKQVVERGVVTSMLDGSHKSLLDWTYLEQYIKEYENTEFAAIKI